MQPEATASPPHPGRRAHRDRPAAPLPRLRRHAGPRAAEPSRPRPRVAVRATCPAYGNGPLAETDADLTRQHAGEPLGERITVTGRVLGSDGRPSADSSSRSGVRMRPGATGTRSTRTTRPSIRTSRGAALPGPTTTARIASRPCFPVRTRGRTTRMHGGRSTSTSLFRARIPRAARHYRCTFRAILLSVRPDLQLDPRRARASAARLDVRAGADAARLGTRFPVRHRARRARGHAARGAAR